MIIINVIVSVVTILTALVIGLLLRRQLVLRLQKTVLDNWAIQTLGIAILLPPLIIGSLLALAVWHNLFIFIQELNTQHHIDLYSLGINLIETLILVGLGVGIARTIKKLTIRGLSEQRIDINTRTLIGRVVYIVVIIIAVFWILSIWQISIGIPVAAVGVVTLVITVAFQDILKDLVAGFYLLLSRPFFIGDQISITIIPNVYTGKVENVELRATRLRLTGGEEATIPNAIVFNSMLMNNTYFSERRATIAVTLPTTDFVVDETSTKIISALREIETIMTKPEPEVLFCELTDEKVTLLVHFWISSRRMKDISEVMYALHALFPGAGLTIREPANLLLI